MDDRINDLSDALVAQSSVKWGMGGGAATSLFGSLSSNDLMVVAGLVFTTIGFLVNTYYQYKRNKRAEIAMEEQRAREEEEHQMRMQLMKLQLDEQENNH